MGKTELSVILVIENETDDVKRTLESLLTQSLGEIQIICISLVKNKKILSTLDFFHQNNPNIRVVLFSGTLNEA